jgi:hypothetical protein
MESLTKDDKEGRSIHIVFTMNTLLNNKQFSNRLREVNDKYGDSSVCVFASVYKGDYKHIKKAEHIFKDPEPTTKAAKAAKAEKAANAEHEMPRIVIACSNTKRFNDCFDIIYKLNEGNTDVKRVFVYFDELHKYIKNTACNIRKHIENINDLDIVSALYAMSASPNNIWSDNKMGFWSNINILQIDNYYDTDYIGYNDIHFTCYGDNDEAYRSTKNTDYIDKGFKDSEIFTINFIKDTLIKYPEILSKYSRVFIPANMRRVSHNYLREHLFAYEPSCVIVMLNGIEKSIQYIDNDGDIISMPLILKEGELGDLIVENIDKYNLHNRPIIFIGYNCVGMGQTLITEKLGNFTSAIFGYDEILNDNMYQLFGRITGRFKNWKNYNVTKVYCTLLCKHISNIMEKCAKNIAINHNNKLLNNTNYLEPFNNTNIDSFSKEEINMVKKNFKIKDYEYNNWNGPLTSIQEVEKVLTQLFKSSITIKDFINIDGYLLSKNLKKYYKKPNIDLKAINRLTIDKYTDITISLKKCISNENKTYKYIVLPVYASLDSTCVEYKLHYSV